MIKLWLVFAILAVLVHLGIVTWRNLNGKDKWTLTKSVGYSIIVTLLVMLAMTVIVILF
jgi:hypothetical protein